MSELKNCPFCGASQDNQRVFVCNVGTKCFDQQSARELAFQHFTVVLSSLQKCQAEVEELHKQLKEVVPNTTGEISSDVSPQSHPTGSPQEEIAQLRALLAEARDGLEIASERLNVCHGDSLVIRLDWLKEQGSQGAADCVENITKNAGIGKIKVNAVIAKISAAIGEKP